jgi:hypothetical protein
MRVGRLHLIGEYPLFLPESVGPGWVLVGHAGHFEDPAGGQCISDALRQPEGLASAIVQGTDGALGQMVELARLAPSTVHWFAADLRAAGRMSPVAMEMLLRLGSTPEGRLEFVELLNHPLHPSKGADAPAPTGDLRPPAAKG